MKKIFTINLPNQLESLRKVRKVAVRKGQAFADKLNDYNRKPKFRKDWREIAED